LDVGSISISERCSALRAPTRHLASSPPRLLDAIHDHAAKAYPSSTVVERGRSEGGWLGPRAVSRRVPKGNDSAVCPGRPHQPLDHTFSIGWSSARRSQGIDCPAANSLIVIAGQEQHRQCAAQGPHAIALARPTRSHQSEAVHPAPARRDSPSHGVALRPTMTARASGRKVSRSVGRSVWNEVERGGSNAAEGR
jgi:hypothetical protein